MKLHTKGKSVEWKERSSKANEPNKEAWTTESQTQEDFFIIILFGTEKAEVRQINRTDEHGDTQRGKSERMQKVKWKIQNSVGMNQKQTELLKY